MTRYAVTAAEIEEARTRIREHVHRTPLWSCRTVDQRAGRVVRLKCENLQKGGAFKARGATNAVWRLDEEQARRGVVTHSSGNHAQALARAARTRGITAHVVMPRNAPSVKRAATEGYGGHVIPCEPTLAAREEGAAAVVRDTGAVLIPPYDHPWVIAGQGTVLLEMLEQDPELDAVVVPVGGGGLASGVALAARSRSRPVAVYGAEPTGADDAWRSRQADRLLFQEAPDTIADGLRTSLGELTWPVVRDCLEDIVRVDDAAIVSAMHLLLERAKLVVEPSGAVALAAVLESGFDPERRHRRVGVVLSGGNLDVTPLLPI